MNRQSPNEHHASQPAGNSTENGASEPIVPEEVVDRFYDRLVALARKKLASLPPQVADEEGAVISAFRSFFSAIDEGRIVVGHTDDDLWRILALITARKSVRQLRMHWKKSGEANRVVRKDDIENLFRIENNDIEQMILWEEFEALVEKLDDPLLKKIVCLRLQGVETIDIAQTLGIHVRSVQRKIKLVQSKWLQSGETA